MAKIDLKFLCHENDNDYIKTTVYNEEGLILITGVCNHSYFDIFLDKPTAIKFAKTLRTEINKMEE